MPAEAKAGLGLGGIQYKKWKRNKKAEASNKYIQISKINIYTINLYSITFHDLHITIKNWEFFLYSLRLRQVIKYLLFRP